MNRKLKRAIKYGLYPIYKAYQWGYYAYGKRHPQWLANKCYERNFGRPISWSHPTEMNEKIRWMQFNTDTSRWSELADKYLVRNFVRAKGYGDILVPLLGKWDNADEIDFSKLPDSFVIKTNHGSGEVVVVKDKANVNLEALRSKMHHYLNTPFGYITAEPHYLLIRPCILAEKMLPTDGTFSSSMVDYKFYCFHGKPYCCAVFYDRDPKTHHTNSSFYDMSWIRHDEWRASHITTPPKDVPRPHTLDRMIQACHDLAAEFPFVRLDFYEAEGQLYFGEFTFTPAALSGGSMNKELCKKLGKLIELPDYKK